MSSYSNTRRCYQLLGITPTATEKEIKTAYRRKALQCHPDKVSPEHKDEANQQFRELYEAYEDAISRIGHNGEEDSRSQRWQQRERKRTSSSNNDDDDEEEEEEEEEESSDEEESSEEEDQDDSNNGFHHRSTTDEQMRKTFFDVCRDLDNERTNRVQEREYKNAREAEAAWMAKNYEECWNILIEAGQLTARSIAASFEVSNPALSQFIYRRLGLWRKEFNAKQAEVERQRVDSINRGWPRRANELKQNAFDTWSLWHYKEIAKKVVHPEAAHAILQWYWEKREGNNVWIKAHQKESANKICRVYPDKKKIADILDGHPPFEWKDIYKLLPTHIRDAIVAIDPNAKSSYTTEASPRR
jgi:curved DNA-binding protein CbpA